MFSISEMAEECVDAPMISEVAKSNNVGLRRRSSRKTSSEINEQKIVPHFLRAPNSSCHDFCKYGKKLALEAKKQSFIPRIAERNKLNRRSQENVGDVVVISGVKLRVSTDSEPTKMSLVKPRASFDSEPPNMSLVKCRVSTDSEIHLDQPESEVVVEKKKASPVKVKQSSFLPKSHNSSAYKTKSLQISSSSKMNTIPKPISKRVEASSISTSKKEELLMKSASKRVKTHPISTPQTAKTSSKSTSKKTQTSSMLSGKHVTPLNLDFCKVASPLMPYSSSKSSSKRVASIDNMHKNLKTASHVKNQPKPRKVEAEEKTLQVIKIESEDQASSISQHSSQKESKYATSGFEENGKENIESTETLDSEVVEENEKAEKDENENLVETQVEKSSPRKVKFKRGKVLKDSTNANETVGEKVVLRCQNLKGKKDEQVLLNNVIEETASKLVETQKSKVKALVGAFETVISLNEKKNMFKHFQC